MPKNEILVWGQGCEAATRTLLTFDPHPQYHDYYTVTADIEGPNRKLTATASFKRAVIEQFFERVFASLEGPEGDDPLETGIGTVSVSLLRRGYLIKSRVTGEQVIRRSAEVILALLPSLGVLVEEQLYPISAPTPIEDRDPEDTIEL